MAADRKFTFPDIGPEFRKIIFQIPWLHAAYIERGKARRIQHIAVGIDRKQLRMPRRLLSPPDLGGKLSDLHTYTVIELIGQGGFPDAGRPGKHRRFPLQRRLDPFDIRIILRRPADHTVAGGFIDAAVILHLSVPVEIGLIEKNRDRNILLPHIDQKTVQQVGIQIGLPDRKNHHRLVDIRDSRPDQNILPLQYFREASFQIRCIRDLKLHVIADEGLDAELSENADSPRGINHALRRMYVIESADPFNNLPGHVFTIRIPA